MTIARDVSQPDPYSVRAVVSASGSIIYPKSGGVVPLSLIHI